MIYQHIIGSRPIFLRPILPIPTASYPLPRRLSATVCRFPNLLAKIFTCVCPFSGRMREYAAYFPSPCRSPKRRIRKSSGYGGRQSTQGTDSLRAQIARLRQKISRLAKHRSQLVAPDVFLSPLRTGIKAAVRRFHKPPPPSWTSGMRRLYWQYRRKYAGRESSGISAGKPPEFKRCAEESLRPKRRPNEILPAIPKPACRPGREREPLRARRTNAPPPKFCAFLLNTFCRTITKFNER